MIDPVIAAPVFDLRGKRVYVAGHTGLAGSAIVRRLASEGCEILTSSHAALDLTRQQPTEDWIMREKPDAIFLAAAKVGGIYANDTYPAVLISDNLAITLNVMRAAVAANVKKLMFLGSSCIYPRDALQPMTEDMLLTGALERTNECYAVAKIGGMNLAQA
jgi:GDP-L-fucose synthase